MAIVWVPRERGSASVNFVLEAIGVTPGNLSAYAAELATAGSVEESKRIVDRKLPNECPLNHSGYAGRSSIFREEDPRISFVQTDSVACPRNSRELVPITFTIAAFTCPSCRRTI
jgi:hypothetical protein